MTTRRELLMGLAAAPALMAGARAASAATAAVGEPEFLFVQSARHMRYAKGKLTLVDVSPITVAFSDRPQRLAGHMLTEDFVPFWSEGDDSFEQDPPNADLSVMSSSDGRVGEYPAGETVKLGSFWSSQAFSIKGMDVPKAYAYIPSQP